MFFRSSESKQGREERPLGYCIHNFRKIKALARF
jgi:hypothetical protein